MTSIRIVALVGLLCCISCSSEIEPPARSIAPSPAPDFNFNDLEGNSVKSDDFKGSILVLNFWATWSPGSAREIPDLLRIYNQFKEKDVYFLGICIEDHSKERILKMAKELEIPYPILIAPPEFHNEVGGINAIPTTIVVDQDWNLINKFTGKLIARELIGEIQRLLQEKEEENALIQEAEAQESNY